MKGQGIAVWLVPAILLISASGQEAGGRGSEQAPTPSAPKTVVSAAQSAAPMVRTVSGIVRGITDAEVEIFKGIPYAAAPVGDYRWRPPQPAPTWQGVRDASEFGAVGTREARVHP